MNRYIAAVLSLCFSGAMVSAQPLELSLAVCREMAIAGSEQLRQAENSMQQATIDTQIATTAYLPKFEGSATGVYMLPDMDMAGAQMRMRGTYMAGIQLMQPIYTGGKITAGRKLARIGREASAEQLRMTRMDVIAEADNAYWSFIAVSDKVRLMQQFRQMIDTLYEQTAVAVES